LKEQDLLDANENLDPTSIQPGQRILIPEKQETAESNAFNEEGFAFHRVKRKETLYSIARFYDVAVQEIRSANPELGWGGPKTGQLIRIPVSQVADHPESVLDTVPVDSLLQAESDSLPADYYYEELNFEPEDPNRTYQVAFFIPFDFQEPEPLDSLLKDVKSVGRRNRIIERYRLEQKVPQSTQFLEFFQGSLLAIDSLRQTGMKLEVQYFDTQKSPDHCRSLIYGEDFKEPDLIIGPFYPFNLEVISEYARNEKIPLVTPFYSELDMISRNPYLFQLTPSLECEYKEAAKLIASKHMYNIVYVREEDSLDIEKHEYFKSLIFDGFDDYRPEEPVVFKELVLKLEHADEIIHSLSKDKKNLVIVPTRKETLASPIVSSLFYRLKDYDIEVIGTSAWTEFSSINFRYYHDLSLIFYTSFWVDYMDPQIDEFMDLYRDQYYNEPTATTRKGINYGIIGYDMTYYFINALRLYGPRFILTLDDYHPDMVQVPFSFNRITKAGGYENAHLTFYQFRPDKSIQLVEVPDPPRRHFFFRPMENSRRRLLIRESE
jgi:LysM repeat protein